MNDIIEKAAANAWFTLIGRGAVVATLAIASWMGLAVISLQSDVKVLSTTVALGMSDRYRADDARRDFQLRDLKLETLTMRLSDLEHEVRTNRIDIKQQEQKIEQVAPVRRPR
jgi:hypothetical protein